MSAGATEELVDLSTETPIWERFFLVAPLALVATKEGDGYDVAPKHMVTPLGRDNYFGFVCSPSHATYRNLEVHPQFTVSFPGADLIVEASLAAGRRAADGSKPTLAALPLLPARTVDGVLVDRCVLYLECELDRVVDGFGDNSLLVGRIVAASAPDYALRGPDVDDADLLQRLRPLVYLAPGRFGVVEPTHRFPLPAGFNR
ncbi:MAG TPA: flavin reductase [Gaiellaceae bacterium]|nr:flavin reductase [Gaiellaceae bacterium]